jgi:hypothetical protein
LAALAHGAGDLAARATGSGPELRMVAHRSYRQLHDAPGVWNPNVYRGLVGVLTVTAEIGGAIWEVPRHVSAGQWQGIDSEIIAGVTATARQKYIFTRTRPSTEDNPCLWFQHGSNYSFQRRGVCRSRARYAVRNRIPRQRLSGNLRSAATAALRRCRAHQESGALLDRRLAGWTVGGLSGWFAHSLDVPIMIRLLPHGFEVGYSKQF